jgi:hypothetical protein
VEDDSATTKPWGSRTGGDALVSVVRSAVEALELSSLDERKTLGVVAAVRPGSTDATCLSQIAKAGVPVVAIAEERDADALETFE